MDILKWKKGILERFGKYKYVLVVILLGVILMAIPARKEDIPVVENTPKEIETEEAFSHRLEETLKMIHGAGDVAVLLTISQGEETVYQTDITINDDGERTDKREQTVLVTDADRNQKGLIFQKNPPTYLGAIILARGADDPVVKLAIVQAVSNVTGLGADRISVLKMN